MVVPGQGTRTVDVEELVFTPEPTYVGTATPMSYRVDTVVSDTVESTAHPMMTAAPVVPPTPIVTVPNVVVTPLSGAPAVFDLPAAVPDLAPDSFTLIPSCQTRAEEFATDDGTLQVEPATGQVVSKPSPPPRRLPAPSPSSPSAQTAPT